MEKDFLDKLERYQLAISSKENLNADTCFASDINSALSGKIEEEPAQLFVVKWPNVIGELTDKQ